MEARIVEFAELLRHNGVRVSVGELQDAARAVALVGVADRDAFRAALQASLVKRAADNPTFERLFAVYFGGAYRLLEKLDESLAKAIEDEGLLEGDELAMVLATLNRLFNGMSPLTQAMLQGDRAALAKLFAQAALRVDFARLENQFQQGFFTRRLLNAAGMEGAQRDLKELQGALKEKGLSTEGLELVGRKVAELMRRVEEAGRRQVEREAQARVRRNPANLLMDRPFANLSTEELQKTEVAVRRLAERLKAKLVRRERNRRKGALNVRRTIRKNLSWGGVPARLQFRTRRPQRPDVVVLCDVSDSVRNVSRMMLLFVFTLQSLFSRVRTFAFVSDVGEITEQLKAVDKHQAVDLSVASEAINVHANSNYGRALASFATDHLGIVTRRTTVLVIGDGRNNYNAANVWALEDIKRKARRLIWICP
ncbi:MAG: VWA domain-containing protein, partial [Myxococcales bacterium]